ncbi:hypothetical protein QWY28_05205 [Nocardioides sp. SOB77]|uniref:ABC3 transporter permease C-terminal domain-containing protein n=1 Tax=Nocardioides oceani TaxID=3058369 RepID=A0ABT8FCN9_9ACTN|nr:FtsX-like permease family protein [Nocardioides oceani]MDN4172330.1 hypothetical protein [Nocardioides oceani]
MRRTLRGAWSRRSTLLPLLLLTVVVTAGCVTVLGVAAAAGTSAALAVPLVVLGAVAVPASGRELAAARRGEVALARLRGLEGRALQVLLALEPLLVLVVGGVAGWLLGTLGAWVATSAWTDAEPAAYTPGGVLAAAAVVLAGLVGVLAGMAGALRGPLGEQVTPAARPRRRGLVATFVDVLVVVAAVVAAYRASTGTGTAPAEDPDLLVLAGPALIGLAVGLAAVLLVRLGARLVVARGGGSLAGFLASRRLARSGDAGDALRVLVAAAVVAAVAGTGASEVDDWTEQTARLRAGAPLAVGFPELDAAGVLRVSHELDPEGRWLMGAVVVPGGGSVPARRVFLDTERYAAVAGDLLAGTPAAGVADRVSELGGTGAGVVTGGTLSVTVQGVSRRGAGVLRPLVTLELRDAGGEERFVPAFAEVPLDGSPVTVERPLTGCTGGCLVERVVLDRTPGTSPLPYVLSGLEVTGAGRTDLDLLDGGWAPEGRDRFGRPGGALPVDLGLLARTADRPQVAVRTTEAPTTPVLATTTATWPDGPPLLDSVGGDERPAEVLERYAALPLVEADGVLADLPRAAVGSPPTVPAAEVMVLVGPDAPADRVAALRDADPSGPAEVRTLAGVRDAVAEESGSAQALVYALVAGFSLGVAVLVLVTAVARERAGWLRDVAALRVVGLPAARLRTAGLAEAAWLAAAAVLATVVGAVLAVRLLLAHLALVDVPEHAVPLTSGLAALPLVLAGLVVAAVVLVVAGRGRSAPVERSRPAILREEAAR